MTDDQFWALIARSRREAGGDSRRQEAALRRLLHALTADEVGAFALWFDTLIHEAYRWDLWGAAYVIGGGCSNDGFWDFRSWLVSRGKTVYRAALRNPESLARVVSRRDRDRGWKNFLNPASFVWEEKTGRPTEECPGLGSNLGQKPAGEEWDDHDLPELFPRLWKEFGWRLPKR